MSDYAEFLPQDEFDALSRVLMGDDFRWFYRKPELDDKGGIDLTGPVEFIHRVYDLQFGARSDAFFLFQPLVERLKAKNLKSLTIHMTPRTHENVKIERPANTQKGSTPHKVAVYHVNTNDGTMTTSDGETTNSKANLLTIYSSDTAYTETTTTDTPMRVTVRIEYSIE